MDKFVGKRLDGRYEIREIIGVGGMAVVYKAYDCIEDRIVAVKILKEEFISNEEFIIRFKNESKAIAVLNHPNIVKVYDVSFGSAVQYIVMEYVDGITLKQYIEKQRSLRWKDAVYLTIQVLRALQHAHDKGIVHRDVKPQNIMLLADGTIKVTDFGIARFARSEHKTMTDKAIGSVHYISPEQARGEATDEKADIYSVGVMLYEMLTGRLPFEADSAVSVAIMQLQQDPVMPRDINDTIPVGLEQITLHAMQKDVMKRYRSAAEMLRDLEEFRRSPDMVFEYSYTSHFVDNEPTRFVDAVTDSDLFTNNTGNDTATDYNYDGDDDDYDDDGDDEKSPVIPILTGVAVAFIIAAIVAVVVFFKVFNKDTGDSIVVPNFVGKTQEQVVEEYPDLQFTMEYRESADYPFGTVIEQKIKEGRTIKKTQKITLIISGGVELVQIPRVYNLSVTDAQVQFNKVGLNPNIIKKHDSTIAVDYVISTNPTEGGYVKPGTVIDVYVSIGPEIKYVENIDCLGMVDSNAAAKLLEEKGLTVKITEKNDTTPAGVVIGQSPSFAESPTLPQGSTVELFVSTGKMAYNYNIKLDDFTEKFIKDYTLNVEYQYGSTVKTVDSFKINSYIDEISTDTSKIRVLPLENITDKELTVYVNLTIEGKQIEKALTYKVNLVSQKDEVVINEEALKDYLPEDTASSDETDSSDSNESTDSNPGSLM